MKIDCKNLPCPAPVLETKKALERLTKGENLSILVNSISAKENVSRFLKTQGFEPEISAKEGEFEISITKMSESVATCEANSCENLGNLNEKILFLKSDKIGNGELGKKLIVGFLGALKDIDKNIKKIICVNESVLMSVDEAHPAFNALKELEKRGVEIINCGTCLEFFGKTKELKVGRIGNAFEILNFLFDENKVVGL